MLWTVGGRHSTNTIDKYAPRLPARGTVYFVPPYIQGEGLHWSTESGRMLKTLPALCINTNVIYMSACLPLNRSVSNGGAGRRVWRLDGSGARGSCQHCGGEFGGNRTEEVFTPRVWANHSAQMLKLQFVTVVWKVWLEERSHVSLKLLNQLHNKKSARQINEVNDKCFSFWQEKWKLLPAFLKVT